MRNCESGSGRTRLAVRTEPRGPWRITRFIYRNHRDREARTWAIAGASVRVWDVRKLV